jgi:uncharacterized membrane protein YbhN (UPF0104 family)
VTTEPGTSEPASSERGGPAAATDTAARRVGGPARPRRERPWRSIVFAPVGDGATRRRGSDVVRIIVSVVVLLVCWVAIGTKAGAEHDVSKWVTPPPQGVKWLIAAVWWVGSLGVILVLAVLALVSRRKNVVRDLLVAGLGGWAVTVLLQVLWGHDGGRPPTSAFGPVDLAFPLAQIAATVAVSFAAMPYLSRALQRLIQLSVLVTAVVAVVHGSGTALSVLASVALGWGLVAVLHLAFGSPLGLPSGSEVGVLLTDLGLDVADVHPVRHQIWGVARFAGHDAAGTIDTSLYGRDARDAQFFAKLARFVMYRDSGPHLALTRLQQTEHEAYVTLMAERAGARVPVVVAAETAGPSRDAVLVTRPPQGERLADAATRLAPPEPAADRAGEPDTPAPASSTAAPSRPLAPGAMTDGQVRSLFTQVLALRRAGIAHGALSSESIILVADDGVGLVDFRCGTVASTPERMDRDVAAALAAAGRIVGTERTVAVARDVLAADVLAASLPFVQRAALDDIAKGDLRGQKPMLNALRTEGAKAADVEVPKLAEPRRISWVTLFLVIGTLVGGWALILVLANVAKSFSTIKGANWAWVTAVFLLAQAAYPSEAVSVLGSVTDPVPFGRATALEVANSFVGLAGGSMAVLATRVRFFQQQGYSATLAVSSGVLVSTASWIVKGALFLIALPIAISSFHFQTNPTDGGSNGSELLWLIVIAVVAVSVLLGVVLLVPRFRRLAADKLRPKASEVWDHLKVLSAHPRNLVEVFSGCLASQLFVAFALGAALHAFDEHLGLASIIIVITLGSMLGGISPVPGGMGVVEAGMIIGLVAAGIPESQAVAAVFVQRMFTSYLPPIWGWFVLIGMRKREYI